jgi:hypothetical protein
LPFAEEERAPVARDVQISYPTAESASRAAAGAAPFIIAAALPGSDARQPAAVFLNRVDDRSVAQAGQFAGDENDSAAVWRDGVIEDRRRHTRKLARAALDSRPVNIDFTRRRGSLVALWGAGAPLTSVLIGGF